MAARNPDRVRQSRRAHQRHLPVRPLPPDQKRRGHAKATIATGHKILTAAYHVLSRGVTYNELGEEFFYRRDTENTERYRRRLIKQLERLGHQVTLEPLPESA
jgi:hypothetical protein